jgi:hypothetical protein
MDTPIMDSARTNPSLDGLESDVLSRITAHRKAQKSIGALPVALLLAFTALASGLLTGISGPHRPVNSRGSEAALLAEEVTLAPSSLLASNQ